MDTKIFKIDPANIDMEAINECAGIIKGGGIVAFPTETVYGLGANAIDEDAVRKIFHAKGRPADNPLIMHILNTDDIEKYALSFNEQAKKLAKEFWPGPMSLILPRKRIVPDITTGGLDTVAFRIPSNGIARELIRMSGLPIAAPSANISGKPSPTDGSHVIDDQMGKVDAIIDAGKCRVGLESTVVDMVSDPPAVLRPGGVSFDQLRMLIPSLQKQYSIEPGQSPRSPGMKYTHYSPEASVVIVRGPENKTIRHINALTKNNPKSGVLCTIETMDFYESPNKICVGSKEDSEEIASNVFDSLRMFDKLDVDIIYCEYFEVGNMGDAIMNRLLKAAGNKVIDLYSDT
ncbi:MAG: L-threonylcarbamoyladenylate synthase [Clostridia bacterium]|nr:L-threonylcarbamoyladenylate synthase [Clostridia bacterium]